MGIEGVFKVRKDGSMITKEIKPEDIMAEENWEEGWKEEGWEIVKITKCSKCGSKLEIKKNGKRYNNWIPAIKFFW